MLRNEKGFTVIELIMSFVFSSILAISLFSVIVAYRSKQTDSTIETELLAFKSQLLMDIQTDIQIKGLKSVDYNYYDDDEDASTPDVMEPRCVVMNYNDGTIKEFRIGQDNKVDIIKNDDGTESQFFYNVPFILYGDIRYDLPDSTSIYIDDDYILHTTSLQDGLETGTKLYKINFNLKHNDLDTNINISIVANGTLGEASTSGPYKVYNIGDQLDIQLNSTYQRKFRVIQYSNSYKNDVTLLYDDVYDDTLVLNSTDYHVVENNANRYENSNIRSKVHAIEVEWNNADEVRLITIEEIARIANFSPEYRGVDSPNVSLATAPAWLTNKTYWTMSGKLLTGDNNGKKVWYVNGNNKTLTSDMVNENHALRPVIIIKKDYIANV